MRLTISNFAGLMSFLPGTRLLTTQADLMQLTVLGGLSMASLPFQTAPVGLFMAWHERAINDPAHG